MKKAIFITLLLLSAPAMAGDGTAAFDAANAPIQSPPPPMSEFDNVPPGLLIDSKNTAAPPSDQLAPAESATSDLLNPNTGAPLPSYANDIFKTAAPEGAPPPTPEAQSEKKRLSLAEVQRAFAAGQYNDLVDPLTYYVSTGDRTAHMLLGILYRNGHGGLPADQKKAFELLSKAADSNQPLAQHHLGIMYYTGAGVTKDTTQALKWLQIAIAHYPNGPGKTRAEADRKNLEASMTRREVENAGFMARDWLIARGEGHLVEGEKR